MKTQQAWSDRAASKISSALLKVQAKTSDAINKRICRVALKKMKVILVAFCLFWGGISIYFLASAVFDEKHSTLKVQQVRLLQHTDQLYEDAFNSKVDKEIYLQIQDFKKFMDSTQSPIRSGLLDSMNMLEQIYLSQQKNEANEK